MSSEAAHVVSLGIQVHCQCMRERMSRILWLTSCSLSTLGSRYARAGKELTVKAQHDRGRDIPCSPRIVLSSRALSNLKPQFRLLPFEANRLISTSLLQWKYGALTRPQHTERYRVPGAKLMNDRPYLQGTLVVLPDVLHPKP